MESVELATVTDLVKSTRDKTLPETNGPVLTMQCKRRRTQPLTPLPAVSRDNDVFAPLCELGTVQANALQTAFGLATEGLKDARPAVSIVHRHISEDAHGLTFPREGSEDG